MPRAPIQHLAPRTGRLNGQVQMWIVLQVLDRTWGERGSPEYAAITMAEIHKSCSDGEDRRYTERCVADLLRRHIIAAITPAEARKRGFAVKSPRATWYRCNVDMWETAPKWEPKKFDQAAVEEPEPETEDEAPAPRATAGSPLVFPSGRSTCRPFRFESPTQEVGFRGDGSAAFQIQPVTNGKRIDFVFSKVDVAEKEVKRGNTGLQTGIGGVNTRANGRRSNTGLQAGIADLPRKGAAAADSNPARRNGKPREVETPTERLELLRDAIDHLLLDRIGAIDDVMLERTAATLGLGSAAEDGVTPLLVELDRVIRQKIRKIAKHAFVADYLAAEAANTYRRGQQMNGRRQEPVKYGPAQLTEARQILDGSGAAPTGMDLHWARYVRTWATENGCWE